MEYIFVLLLFCLQKLSVSDFLSDSDYGCFFDAVEGTEATNGCAVAAGDVRKCFARADTMICRTFHLFELRTMRIGVGDGHEIIVILLSVDFECVEIN